MFYNITTHTSVQKVLAAHEAVFRARNSVSPRTRCYNVVAEDAWLARARMTAEGRK
jgi:hypothetical protein